VLDLPRQCLRAWRSRVPRAPPPRSPAGGAAGHRRIALGLPPFQTKQAYPPAATLDRQPGRLQHSLRPDRLFLPTRTTGNRLLTVPPGCPSGALLQVAPTARAKPRVRGPARENDPRVAPAHPRTTQAASPEAPEADHPDRHQSGPCRRATARRSRVTGSVRDDLCRQAGQAEGVGGITAVSVRAGRVAPAVTPGGALHPMEEDAPRRPDRRRTAIFQSPPVRGRQTLRRLRKSSCRAILRSATSPT